MLAAILHAIARDGLLLQEFDASEFADFASEAEWLNDEFFSVVTWMEREGLIEHLGFSSGGGEGPHVSGVQISSKALAILGVGYHEDLSLGSALEEAAKAPEPKMPYSRLGEFIGGLLGGFTKSVS